MIVVVITCVVVIVALVVANFRLRTRGDELATLVRATTEERDLARADAAAHADEAATVRSERDDALQRVDRARRDAAAVANRLSAETAAREASEGALEATRRALDAARAAGVGDLADVLWDLSLRQTEATWRLSVAVDPSAPSPLQACVDPFRTAVEVEIDAAREESGAVFELTWTGDGTTPTERSVVALAAVRDIIDQVGTVAASTSLTIACRDDAVELTVASIGDDGEPVEVAMPAPVESGPGSARIA